MPRTTHHHRHRAGSPRARRDHWQTRLAAKLPNAVVVPSFTRDKRDLAGRVADLHQVISDANTPVTIVAHSAGVLTTVHWALRHDLPVRGALLATPPDLARPLGPLYPLAELRGQRLAPHPVGTAQVSHHRGGQHERRARRRRARAGHGRWGSHLIDIGPVGHLNPAVRYGEWLGAEALLGILNGSVPAPHHGHVALESRCRGQRHLTPTGTRSPGRPSNSLA